MDITQLKINRFLANLIFKLLKAKTSNKEKDTTKTKAKTNSKAKDAKKHKECTQLS